MVRLVAVIELRKFLLEFSLTRRLYPVDKNRLDDGNQDELEAVDKKTK